MPKRSAGIILFRKSHGRFEVLLVHPGGPFWSARDEGAWSIPKGEYSESEDALTAAKRELQEETGIVASEPLMELGVFKQPGGKLISAFAMKSDFDPRKLTSNSCTLEWPPRSGRVAIFPEVDRAAWFSIEEAKSRIVEGQIPILQSLAKKISHKSLLD
jgi:predicted NUDIX family NTP pyrophosphohydrolase